MLDLDILETWSPPVWSYIKVIDLGSSLMIIGDSNDFVDVPMLEQSWPNLQVVHHTELNQVITIISALSISMRAKHMFKVRSVYTNLDIHVIDENDYVMSWSVINQILKMLIELVLSSVIMIIWRCITLYDCALCMHSDECSCQQVIAYWCLLWDSLWCTSIKGKNNTTPMDIILPSWE